MANCSRSAATDRTGLPPGVVLPAFAPLSVGTDSSPPASASQPGVGRQPHHGTTAADTRFGSSNLAAVVGRT